MPSKANAKAGTVDALAPESSKAESKLDTTVVTKTPAKLPQIEVPRSSLLLDWFDPSEVASIATVADNLSRRKDITEKDDDSLIQEVSTRITELRGKRQKETIASAAIRKVRGWSVCVPVNDLSKMPSGNAMLIGLKASEFGWTIDTFTRSIQDDLDVGDASIGEALNKEFSKGGYNESFHTVLQTSFCTVGRAGQYLEEASIALGLGPVEIGGSAGHLACNIGGTPNSCSESAARIAICPAASSDFQIQAVGGDKDIVTLNGNRIMADSGPCVLRNQDICSVGTRVFMFLKAPTSK